MTQISKIPLVQYSRLQ